MLNDLTAKEWTKNSRSVWPSSEVSPPRNKARIVHGATFPIPLAKKIVSIYSKKGDLVLDPFSGVGTTLMACRELDRDGVGTELYQKFYDSYQNNLNQKLDDSGTTQELHRDDCRNLGKYVKDSAVQLTLTSPPYSNFIQQSVKDRQTAHKKSKLVEKNNSTVSQYGESPDDFGNLEYPAFLQECKRLMDILYQKTRPGGYNVWVVKDHRNTKNGIPYIPVHSDIARVGTESGFVLHDLIIWDQNESRALVILGYPSVFYVNINHTFIVVMRKP